MKTTNMKYLITIFIPALLYACSSPDGQSMKFDHDYLEQKDDSIEIPEFEISVQLSNKAEQKLLNSNESIIVMAFFTGRPIDKIPEKYKKNIVVDELFLRAYPIELTDKRKAKFQGIKFHKDLYTLLADKDIQLLINIYSGRKAGHDNILDCDLLQDKMSNVADKTFNLEGKLIEE